MVTTKSINCLDCNQLIWSGSLRCKSCAKSGVLNTFYGKKHSKKTLKKVSGKNHFNWKGNKAKYAAIHVWINNHKGTAKCCIACGITSKDRRIEWSNKDHKYLRNLSDYISLCVICHYIYDIENGLRKYTLKQSKITGKFISS